MSGSKFLSGSGWKDVAAKNNVKDNGLLKKLADLQRVGDDKHDETLKLLDETLKLATQLKKDKKTPPAAGKYLDEITAAAEASTREVSKAKSEAEKANKAKAEADKKKQAEAGGEDEEEAKASELLTTQLKPLLREVAKGERMHALVAKGGKQVVVLLSRKPIPPSRRKMLADELGGSSVKYYPGHCVLEAGATTFVLQAEVAGMAKLIKAALLEQTGLRLNKVKCRGEDGDDDDNDQAGEAGAAVADHAKADDKAGAAAASAEPQPGMARPFEVSATVGQGGKNLEDDVKAVQAALNRRADARLTVDGRCGPATIEAIIAFQRALGQSKPDGRVEPRRGTARALAASGKIGKPPPPPNPKAPPADLGAATLARAPQVWHGTREILDHNINELKRAIRQEYASEHPTVLGEIDRGVQRVDVILEKLDVRLAHALERAGAATDAAKRKAELASAKTIIADYIAFVKSEPLIEHIDKNPFGVNVQVRKVITDSLAHMIKSMA